ncbi:AAA family ATPase [Faecalibacterium sp. DFI.5.82]|uniref:AAA family ATPase n=1 Tax=Faecalibacterium sp. DFI.5.82 TaxID=3031725 RepID=UPI0023B05938|nr:AAA family ATPase [Faecalibacterium sp. DFI.5.82]MDE8689987.1 AAA family ATPase [Faecalibacterium sp. DFI.5.82]
MTYTQAQIDKANAVDLEKFLRAQGETLVRSGKEYRWKAHDSLTVCGNKWFRHSQSKGGLPVDFVMEFYGKSFPEAVQMLTGEPGEAQPEAGPAPSPAFRLPLRNVTNANILNYLTQERKLSPSLVNFFIAAGDIYEDSSHHNVVFVGRDADGHPRYASSRGINEKFRQDAAGAEKAFGFVHRGTDKQLLVFEAPIDLLSFIELFPKNWQQHNYLSLGGVSGKALRQFLSERPDVERVFLCLDADKAGEDACKRLTALLPDTVSVTRIQPCMKDWNDVLVHRAEIPNRNYFKSIVLKEPSKPETVKIIRMSDVELTPVEWLWKPYLPFGKLSVLQGNPGEGKTYFAMHLAAACTNGKLLPNMERVEPFNVIYQTAEDGLGDTVKPRLIEAGADLDRVLVIDDSDVQLTLSDERIEKAIVENNARLVIIDPIQAYLGADVDMNRANEVRPIFMRLGQVAQRTGCAILLIGHLNKAAGMQSLQRGLGSIDIAAAVRSVMFIGKLKHDPTMRILTHEKSSLAPPGVSLAFSLGDEGGFRWVGEYDITADEMLSGIEPQRETKTQQAKDLICALLAEGKQVLSEDIDKAALERGIPGRTVRDAKRELGDALKSKIVEGRKKVFWME